MGADDWHDPHDLIPEQFRERFGDSETVAAALRRAESRPSTTPADERRRCPECYSPAITPKSPDMGDSDQRKPGAWMCTECCDHFSDPLKMNLKTTAFDWIDPDELADPDERGETPIFATLDEQTRTALAIVLYRPWTEDGPSYRDMKPLFPHSHYWIGKQVRAWKDGEHRELVPNPTPADDTITVDESSGATAVATDGGRRRWDAYGS